MADTWREAWAAAGDRLMWHRPSAAVWEPGPRMGTWYPGGELNLAVNCVDRHTASRGDTVAFHWEGEPGDRRSVTYAELQEHVVTLAKALRGLGVGPGDRVALHLGLVPEAIFAMLAAARLGAVFSIVATSLPPEGLADRLASLSPKVVFTQDGAWRHGTVLPLKSRADDALSAAEGVEHTVVVRRTGMDVAWYEGDRWYHDLTATARPRQAAGDDTPVPTAPDHPVVSASLAHQGGEPVSVLLGAANLLVSAGAVHDHIAGDGVLWCAGNLAWSVTIIHGILGPLSRGATFVVYEGTLDVPTHARAWDIIERYAVESLLTPPSVLRTMRGWSRELPEVARRTPLARVTMAGEPVEPELRRWLGDALGDAAPDVADAWGQVELGGIVRVVGLNGAEPLPDCGLDVVDEAGRPVEVGGVGEVVLRHPWAGTLCGLEGTHADNLEDHWTRRDGVYATEDLAELTREDDVMFLGRADAVVSIAGQIVSLGEVKAVISENPFVADAEVTWRKDPRLGRALVAVVALRPEATESRPLDRLAVDLMDSVREVLGGLARPRAVLFVDRFGDELSPGERFRAFGALAASDTSEPRLVPWQQVVAASGHGG